VSQQDKVLAHLQNTGTLTQIDAATRYNIWRLAAVIHKLRQRGHVITSTRVRHRAGGTFAVYRLEGALGSPQNVFHVTQPEPVSQASRVAASLTLNKLRQELSE
jgi:hypothetical protein